MMKIGLLLLLTCALALNAQAGSATWNLNPASNDWNTAGNWTPATVPNRPDDVATFEVSNVTSLTLSNAEVASVVFNPGASAYTITATTEAYLGGLDIGGEGIINRSGIVQNFVLTGLPAGTMDFTGQASAGEQTVFTNEGGYKTGYQGMTFHDSSNAGHATIVCQPGVDTSRFYAGNVRFSNNSSADHGTFICNGSDRIALAGDITFTDSATAGNGTIVCGGATGERGTGAYAAFFDAASAGTATFTAEGSDFARAGGGSILFYYDSSASDATLIANGGQLAGGRIVFFVGNPDGARARVKIFGNGELEIASHEAPGVKIGSLEGDGAVTLGANTLAVGSNDLSTTFDGIIEGSGSLTKIGTGHLTLTNASTYSGMTRVAAGALRVGNLSGSATGTGLVEVSAGILGGRGIIAGSVTIGSGSGAGASLAPGVGASAPTVISIQDTLTFKADATYSCRLNTKKARSDQLKANGVTIESGAQFDFTAVGNRTLAAGASFTLISNTGATPISGTFANLPNGGTLTVGPNTFQASYSGGDGNDLTLTVVP